VRHCRGRFRGTGDREHRRRPAVQRRRRDLYEHGHAERAVGTSLIDSTYTTFLRRPASPGELAFWLSFLKGGAPDEQLRAFVIGSDE